MNGGRRVSKVGTFSIDPPSSKGSIVLMFLLLLLLNQTRILPAEFKNSLVLRLLNNTKIIASKNHFGPYSVLLGPLYLLKGLLRSSDFRHVIKPQ